MDIVCLLIWIFQLVLGIKALLTGEEINPLIFLCAVMVCILHYLQEIFLGD